MGRVDDKVVLVTGAAKGMGAAHVRALAAEGARVLATDVLEAEGQQLADELGDVVDFRRHDVTDEQGWQSAVTAAVETFGRLDVLVNNAGVLLAAPLERTTLADYRRIVDVNQVGCFLGMRAVAPVLRDGGGGSIVNLSSIAGLTGAPMMVAYTASKWAIRGMTRAAAKELGADGIRVNSVHPGGVDTDMFRDLGVDPDAYTSNPAGRIGQPEEVAELVVWLASDASAYCTGAEFKIDGGASA